MERKIIVRAIDIDGTLTNSVCWTEEEMEVAEPNQAVIDIVNGWAKESFIVIYTARRDCFYQVTVNWLRKNGVIFHSISMGKMPADMYLDDLAFRPEEYLPIKYKVNDENAN
jgi:hypothetical protein